MNSVLHIHTLPIISGSGINTLLTMKGAVARGFRVGLACESEGRLTAAARQEGIAVHLVPEMRREINPWWEGTAVIRLKSLIRQQGYEIVHTHNSKAGFLGRLAGRLAGAELVVHTVHGFAFHSAEAFWRRLLFRSLERLAARWCDGMIFISQPMVEWADREGIGPAVPRRLIYSGIDAGAFSTAEGGPFRRQWGIAPERLVVGIVSKLWEGKGHENLLRAWREIVTDPRIQPEPLLVIVGEGHLQQRLRERVREWKLERQVLFTGFQADVASVTAALDVSVLPSLFEGMGRVVLEAMAAGKPVIASRVGGLPDLVRDGVGGILVPPGDVIALRDALSVVLLRPELRARLAEGCRQSLKPEYTAAWMVEEIHSFYATLPTRI